MVWYSIISFLSNRNLRNLFVIYCYKMVLIKKNNSIMEITLFGSSSIVFFGPKTKGCLTDFYRMTSRLGVV